MRRLLLFAPLVLLLVLSGCGLLSRPSGPTFSAEAEAYAPGDAVPVTLRNAGRAEVGYNLCAGFLVLERDDDGWAVAPVPLTRTPDTACTAQLNLMGPGEEAASTAYLPADLPAGSYRLVTTVEVDGVQQQLTTGAFRVR